MKVIPGVVVVAALTCLLGISLPLPVDCGGRTLKHIGKLEADIEYNKPEIEQLKEKVEQYNKRIEQLKQVEQLKGTERSKIAGNQIAMLKRMSLRLKRKIAQQGKIVPNKLEQY